MVVLSEPETTDISTKSKKESGAAMVARALREFSKSSPSALQMDTMPPETLFTDNADYSRWTMVLNDKNLKTLSEQGSSGRKYFLECSSSAVNGMFNSFWTPISFPHGILRLNISGSKIVTDYGITVIARSSPNLKCLNISGCPVITDIGIREVGVSCINLQELYMSSCHGVIGSGLIAIAECCRFLLKFDVSKCKCLKGWSLAKIFYSCTRLEEVNVSYLKEVGDDEVRVLAQNCHHLVYLNAVECCYISDTSVLILAQHCTDLDFLDLSRTQMVFRITDTCLLALSQHCPSMKTLRLNGCENVTDVGLTWLAEGCKVIEEIDVSRCTKVSDAGLRSLGNSCHNLTSLDVSHSKLITDVGVSSLSYGCPKLKKLNCHGVFMLADPRLSAPSKGAKLEAWQTLIGVAALATHCPNIENLDLSGCFRLNIALHQYVSSLSHLKSLNISACNQVASESLEEVAKGCVLLEEIVLTDCGKGVNSKAMAAFAMHCKNMKTIVVSRCTQINGAAIKAISLCEKLEKLDVSGCRALTDNMLLHLCDASKVPMLRTINFCDLPGITDSILAWIAMRTHRILLFAMKGTCISKKAMMSVRDRFPNSDVLQNDNFYGYWPKFRVDDRILLNNYHRFIDGMIRIQARLRSQLARRRVAGIAKERIIQAAHLLIHKIARGFIARKRVHKRKLKIQKLDRQARLIAHLFRIPVAKKKLLRKRIAKREKHVHESVIRVQLRWRIFASKKRLQEHRDNFLVYWAKRVWCATKIQSVARLRFAVKRISRIKDMNRGRENLINRKALMIQRKFRGFLARRRAAKLKTYYARLRAEKFAAIVKIQRKYRVYRTQKILRVILGARLHHLHSAILIQAVMRGALARLHVAEMVNDRLESALQVAATKIQSRARIILAKNKVQRKKAAKLLIASRYAASAMMIVKQCRVKVAHIRLRRKREEYFERVRSQAQKEINSVIKIQALQRGVKGRSLFNAKIREKKGKWKELFDEKTNKRFFYNKLSGEIRWRMPQDLVDLIPRAPCDNCSYYEASVECASCNEMFCSQCWDQVHYGGRRKDHEFRSLYDFYGRRMDYGDGVFPCKWPSEVIQDEIQGWMLRVEPIRQAVASYTCGWEEYVDDATNEGRTFFFHRLTFEASYTVPVEVQQERDLAALKAANAQQLGGYYDENKNWVSTNTYIESWMNAAAGAGVDTDFSVLPYPTTATSNSGRPPSAGLRTGPIMSQRGMHSARAVPISGRRHESSLDDHYDYSHQTEEFPSNVNRELFKDLTVTKTKISKK